MTSASTDPTAVVAPPKADGSPPAERVGPLDPILESLGELADDLSVPRNIRRGAQSARDALNRARAPLDVRVASAVNVLDDLANDPNLPTHGRTAIWSIISNLESLQ